MSGGAAARWRELQEGRGIPPDILTRAPGSPWGLDTARFEAPAVPVDTPSRRAALGLLAGGGTVLDIGCGGGDASLALAGVATHVTANDQQQDMLDLFAGAAAARGVAFRTVLGRWPDVAPEAGVADVVVSHLVLHNVVDLPPFLRGLTTAAGRGVVVEMLAEHPMAWLDPLWLRFHGLRRPRPAITDDAVAVLIEIGIAVQVTRWERTTTSPQDAPTITRRLCLDPARVVEVAAALAALPPRPQHAATLRWTA